MTGRILQKGSVLATNEYGLDVLTRPFRVRNDVAADLLPLQGEADTVYPDLTFSTYKLTDLGGGLSDLVIEYVGHVRGNHREPKHEYGRRLETVQLGTLGALSLQQQVDYYAPYTVYKYVSEGIPVQARFAGPIIVGPPILQIKGKRPATASLFAYKYEDVLGEITARQRGRFYEVEEPWSREIVTPGNKLTLKLMGGVGALGAF